jgi:hypothetical protein
MAQDAVVHVFPAERARARAERHRWVVAFDDAVWQLDEVLSRLSDRIDAAAGSARAALVAGRAAFRTEWARRRGGRA